MVTKGHTKKLPSARILLSLPTAHEVGVEICATEKYERESIRTQENYKVERFQKQILKDGLHGNYREHARPLSTKTTLY